METAGAAHLSCESEQIQHLNAIQPDGFLLSVGEDWKVLRASENVEAFLGVAPDQVLGLPVRHLGLRYPASDIPAQARALYERSYLRTSNVDVDAVPVPVASGAAAGGHALDLSMSVLRSVSPVHLEYLRNMGVRASMSVSILRGGRLWGLFACHHRQPRRVGYETLSTVEMFAHMFSHLLEEHAREGDAVFDALILEMRDKLVGAAAGSMLDRVPDLLVTLGELIPCDGIAVIAGGDAMLAGWTPTRAEILA